MLQLTQFLNYEGAAKPKGSSPQSC